MELSPEDIRKDKGKILPKDFTVYLWFEDYCREGCAKLRTMDLHKLCSACKKIIGEQQLQHWHEVKSILEKHEYPTIEQGRRLLANVDDMMLQQLL